MRRDGVGLRLDGQGGEVATGERGGEIVEPPEHAIHVERPVGVPRDECGAGRDVDAFVGYGRGQEVARRSPGAGRMTPAASPAERSARRSGEVVIAAMECTLSGPSASRA